MSRIAVFQYDWPLQSHTVNLVAALASAGHEVDLFLWRCSMALIDAERLGSIPGLTVIHLDRTPLRRAFSVFERALYRFSFTAAIGPVVRLTLRKCRTYGLLIGIEKKGMIWAGAIAEATGTPFVYFSLELYDEEHPAFVDTAGFAALRDAEKRFHRKAVATIVQDRQRGEYLLRSNEIRDHELMFFPVSVPGPAIRVRRDDFRARFGIAPDIPLILYIGLIDADRHCVDIARGAAAHKGRFAFLFHGYGEPSVLMKVREEGRGAVFLSTELVAEEELTRVVASADIGLAIYRTDCANDRLTAFSSEKVALYTRCGVPFIAYNTESYRSLMADVECGVLVDDAAGVPDAAARILADYERYRINAFKAFERHYRFESNIEPIVARIGELARMS